MESPRIKILLNRYWAGNSSIEEEAQLRELFGTEVPTDEQQYAILFEYTKLSGEGTNEEFDLDFLPVDAPASSGSEKIQIPAFVRWSMGVAATVLIAILSIMYQWPETQTVQTENEEIERAYTETLAALQMVSDELNKGKASIMEIGVFDRTKNYILDESN